MRFKFPLWIHNLNTSYHNEIMMIDIITPEKRVRWWKHIEIIFKLIISDVLLKKYDIVYCDEHDLMLTDIAVNDLRENYEKDKEREIAQFTINNFYLQTFPSIISAERETGVDSGNIIKVAKGYIVHAGGYKWHF